MKTFVLILSMFICSSNEMQAQLQNVLLDENSKVVESSCGLVINNTSKSGRQDYRYLHSVNSNGVKIKNPSLENAFNTSNNTYFLYFHNQGAFSFYTEMAESTLYFQFISNDGGIITFKGPYLIDPHNTMWGYSEGEKTRLGSLFGIRGTTKYTLYIYFSSDMSRMNVKAGNMTHVFSKISEPSESTPSQLY